MEFKDSSLLEIHIDHNNEHSPCICYIYKTRVLNFEKALAELTASKTLARSSQSEIKKIRGPLKRCKVTSGSIVVSPDISR